jgi:hypothetical protein
VAILELGMKAIATLEFLIRRNELILCAPEYVIGLCLYVLADTLQKASGDAILSEVFVKGNIPHMWSPGNVMRYVLECLPKSP